MERPQHCGRAAPHRPSAICILIFLIFLMEVYVQMFSFKIIRNGLDILYCTINFGLQCNNRLSPHVCSDNRVAPRLSLLQAGIGVGIRDDSFWTTTKGLYDSPGESKWSLKPRPKAEWNRHEECITLTKSSGAYSHNTKSSETTTRGL